MRVILQGHKVVNANKYIYLTSQPHLTHIFLRYPLTAILFPTTRNLSRYQQQQKNAQSSVLLNPPKDIPETSSKVRSLVLLTQEHHRILPAAYESSANIIRYLVADRDLARLPTQVTPALTMYPRIFKSSPQSTMNKYQRVLHSMDQAMIPRSLL